MLPALLRSSSDQGPVITAPLIVLTWLPVALEFPALLVTKLCTTPLREVLRARTNEYMSARMPVVLLALARALLSEGTNLL